MRLVNGFRLLQVLHKNISKPAIVMFFDSELDRVDALQVGVTNYLQKPISAEQLENIMKQIAFCCGCYVHTN